MSKKAPPARVLEEWTERDLTAAALKDDLPPAFEIDEQVALATDVLSGGRNLLIAGEAGVGKTALVCELVRRAARGSGPQALAGRRVLQFSFRHRVATLKEPKMLLPEMQRLIDALCQADGEIVPFFRDFHRAYTFDLEPQLQTLGYRLPGPILGEAEPATLSALFESLPELEQQYVTLTLDEPDLERTSRILAAWAAHHAARTGQTFTPGALEEALHLAHRFLARSRLPRKALDLLVQVGSLSGPVPRVGRSAVIDRFSKTHHVPRVLLDPNEPLDLAAFQTLLGEELLGQDEAVAAITRMIGLIKSGMSDTRRPFGVFLFVGPTGVGKTHAAQLLARQLFGSRDRILRLNMADYKSESAPEVLFGHPSEYTLPLRRGVVTQRIAGQPLAVLLLDEFEKAHEKVADRFLQLFDEGAFINGHGETVACRSMTLIATSNVGAELYREQPAGFFSAPDIARLAHELERRLSQRFRAELLNRFDQIVLFHPLSRADVRTIAARELDALKDRIGFKRSGLELDVDEAVLDWLAVHGYDPRFGARFLRRTLEREVTSTLAGLLVRGQLKPGTRALLTVRRNRIDARLVIPEAPSASQRQPVTLPLGSVTRTRALDREALNRKAAELLKAAAGPLSTLAARREEARRLLDAMNAPGFWDGAVDSREALESYRRLDVTIQVEERFARPVRELEAFVQGASGPRDAKGLASAVEAAARALREWNDRSLEEGVRDAWLLIERADALRPSEPWLSELTRLELSWCRRVQLETSVVACEMTDGELSRVILQVEGPGVTTYLAAEEGVHHRKQKAGPDLKARIAVVPRAVHAARPPWRIAPMKRRQGPFGLSLSCTGRLETAASGFIMDLLGSEPMTLTELLADLDAYRRREPEGRSSVARTYGKDGVGARDPRTGVTMLRLKEVLRGELDPFLEGWRARSSAKPVRSTMDL